MYTMCRGCNNGFETDYGSKKYCNESCRMNVYKKRICKNCSNKIPYQTIIDGVNPKEKSFNITAREFSFSKKRLVSELIKCIAVCHNCHGEIHDELIAKEIVSIKHAELIDKLTTWK